MFVAALVMTGVIAVASTSTMQITQYIIQATQQVAQRSIYSESNMVQYKTIIYSLLFHLRFYLNYCLANLFII